jgi:hypothetical protein
MGGGGLRSWYNDWLRAGRSGDRISVGVRFSAFVQTGPGTHPASCTTGTGSFSGVKSGRGVTLTLHPLLVPWSRKSRAIPVLPLWVVRPVQSFSACTSVHFTLLLWRCDPMRVMASSVLRFIDHTQRRITVSRTPLDEWSARRRDFYLTTHNTHNGQTSMPPVGFEPTTSAGEWPQTYALDRAIAGTDILPYIVFTINSVCPSIINPLLFLMETYCADC